MSTQMSVVVLKITSGMSAETEGKDGPKSRKFGSGRYEPRRLIFASRGLGSIPHRPLQIQNQVIWIAVARQPSAF